MLERFCVAMSLLCGAFASAAPMMCAAVPASPGPALVVGENDADWQPLFRRLAAQGSVRSTFTEQRWLSIRKEPIVLRGEMRHDRAHGLSLHYREPKEQLIVIDPNGLLMRDAAGRERSLPPAKSLRIDTLLLPVLTFNVEQLQQHFIPHAAREGEAWRVDFVPRTTELQRQLGTLTVFGTLDRVRQIEFRRSASQRVVVTVESTEQNVTFSPEELDRYFR